MRNLLFSLGFLSLLFAFTSIEKNTSKKTQQIPFDAEYCNMDYFFCLEYPADILTNENVSTEGNGIKLSSVDNEIVVTVKGNKDIKGRDSWDLYNDLIEENPKYKCDVNFRYEIITPEFYKVSYKKNGKLVYQKLFNQGNKYIIYEIVVPEDKRFLVKNIRKRLDLNFGI